MPPLLQYGSSHRMIDRNRSSQAVGVASYTAPQEEQSYPRSHRADITDSMGSPGIHPSPSKKHFLNIFLRFILSSATVKIPQACTGLETSCVKEGFCFVFLSKHQTFCYKRYQVKWPVQGQVSLKGSLNPLDTQSGTAQPVWRRLRTLFTGRHCSAQEEAGGPLWVYGQPGLHASSRLARVRQ